MGSLQEGAAMTTLNTQVDHRLHVQGMGDKLGRLAPSQ